MTLLALLDLQSGEWSTTFGLSTTCSSHSVIVIVSEHFKPHLVDLHFHFMCAAISSPGGRGVGEFLPLGWFESGVARGLCAATSLTRL